MWRDAEELQKLDWDYRGAPFLLEEAHIVSALDGFIAGAVPKDDLVRWAEILELREDIEFPEHIKKVIFEIANPDLGYELDAPYAVTLRNSVLSG